MRDRFYDEEYNNRDWYAVRASTGPSRQCLGAAEFSHLYDVEAQRVPWATAGAAIRFPTSTPRTVVAATLRWPRYVPARMGRTEVKA